MLLLYSIAPLLLMVFCIVHAIRTGRDTIWVFVVIFLPGIGSLIYLALEVLPGLMGSRGARQMARGMQKIADPNRDFRAAMRDVELTGSVDAKRNLADHYIERGHYAEAAQLYESALTGQFASDPALLTGLAKARFLSGDGAAAQAALDRLTAADPSFVSADGHLLYARALEAQGKDDAARQEYARLVPYFAGEEARCRYALLLQRLGEHEAAKALFKEVLRSFEGAPGHYRKAQREWAAIARKNL